jgi:cbb3-type cytochrome oxidase cytochrome c subunit
MKGLVPLFLGIFGTFAFSWVGLTLIPNWQIGHLNPESDEEGTDFYPRPQSGMFERGARVYAANGCVYCHSEQVRADYAADDIERKWGTRRSAPRDYVFDRPIFLGKMRMGQDLANIGARAPAEQESPAPGGAAAPGASPAPAQTASSSGTAASPSPAGSPATQRAAASSGAVASAKAASPAPATAAASSSASSPATAPAASSASPPPKTSASPAPAGAPSSPSPAAAVAGASPAASPSPSEAPWPLQTAGLPPMYSAAWQHVHLYSPRSINVDSNMPAYRFLYEKRRIIGERSAEALQLTGSDAPPEGWEVVPSYDAKCLVAYLTSLNQSHPLKDVPSVGAAAAASPAASGSPAPAAASPAPSPAPAK